MTDILEEGGRGSSGGPASRRLLNGMVSGQVALALPLSAGVMIRSFSRLLQVDPGFRTEDVLVAMLSLPNDNQFASRESQVLF